MRSSPLKTIWIGLVCVGVLGYLLLVGQISVRRFEQTLIRQMQRVAGENVDQNADTIKTAVAAYARDVNVQMVCLFSATLLIGLLYCRAVKRQVVYEQQAALSDATRELHRVAECARRMQDDNERQAALYRGVLNAVPMGLYWKDENGRLMGYNRHYACIAGLKRMEEAFEADHRVIVERRQDGLPLDMEVMTKDIELLFLPQSLDVRGTPQNYLVSKAAVKDAQGRVCGLLCGLLGQEAFAASEALAESDQSGRVPPPSNEKHTKRQQQMDREYDLEQENTEMQEERQSGRQETNVPAARILIVDDVAENRTLLNVILSKLGYDCVQCDGGTKAVRMCRDERFDLVLMDIQMPDINGLEATCQIRSGGVNSDVPIIAMTASDQRDDELLALESGCDDYLTKPINRNMLEKKIWRSLARTQQIQKAREGLEITSFLEGDPDYFKTIETFVSNLPGRIEELREDFEKNDYEGLAFKAHALKGLGGFAGFAVYTEKAARIEEAIREKNVDELQTQIDEMVKMCVRTKVRTDSK